ncbi:unnamed protein product, partial [Protopolystoma xenopodis]
MSLQCHIKKSASFNVIRDKWTIYRIFIAYSRFAPLPLVDTTDACTKLGNSSRKTFTLKELSSPGKSKHCLKKTYGNSEVMSFLEKKRKPSRPNLPPIRITLIGTKGVSSGLDLASAFPVVLSYRASSPEKLARKLNSLSGSQTKKFISWPNQIEISQIDKLAMVCPFIGEVTGIQISPLKKVPAE